MLGLTGFSIISAGISSLLPYFGVSGKSIPSVSATLSSNFDTRLEKVYFDRGSSYSKLYYGQAIGAGLC